MSDNPADSLRRELEAASWYSPDDGCDVVRLDAATDAVEAARADERERIAKAIEAQACSPHFVTLLDSPTRMLRHLAVLVRGLGEETTGVDSKINTT